MDNIHKYFYLIVFAGYMREASSAAREAIAADKKGDVALPSRGNVPSPPRSSQSENLLSTSWARTPA